MAITLLNVLSSRFNVPRTTTKLRHTSFSGIWTVSCNSLPQSVHGADTITCFKQLLKTHFLNTKQCWNLVTGSHHQCEHLSCLISGVNRIGQMLRLSATENLETVLSSPKKQRKQSFVLSRPSFQSATRTCLQTCSHCRRDWTKLILKAVGDCHQLHSHNRQHKTKQSCLVRASSVN